MKRIVALFLVILTMATMNSVRRMITISGHNLFMFKQRLHHRTGMLLPFLYKCEFP